MKKIFEFTEGELIVDTITTRHAFIIITNKAVYLQAIIDAHGAMLRELRDGKDKE